MFKSLNAIQTLNKAKNWTVPLIKVTLQEIIMPNNGIFNWLILIIIRQRKI